MFLIKVGLIVQYSSQKKNGKIRPIFNTGKLLRKSEFWDVVHNFGKSDGDII